MLKRSPENIPMSPDKPLGELSRDDLLVLFEWAHRFCETNKLAFSHHAEVVVLDKLAGGLERAMSEPFEENYTEILSSAHRRVLARYENQMGKTWIHEQVLEQA